MKPAAPPRVLVIGLDPLRVPGPWDPEPVVRSIEAGLAKFAEHGIGAEACLVGLDGSDDVEAAIAFNDAPDTTWEAAARWLG